MKRDARPKALKPRQKRLLEQAQECGYGQTFTQICEDAGVPLRTAQYWMRSDPVFREAWENLWRPMAQKHLPAALAALVKRAKETGEPQAVKLLAELAGLLKKEEASEAAAGKMVLEIVADGRPYAPPAAVVAETGECITSPEDQRDAAN